MIRRFGINFAILSIMLDGFFSMVSLWVANEIRPFLLNFPTLNVPELHPGIPIWMYGVVPFIWVTVLFFTSAYDPKRIYKLVDELPLLTGACGLAALVFAGLVYLGFRDFSRWLFLLFVVITWFSLVSWRVTSRLLFRLYKLPSQERRVLIVGAGEVGTRVSHMIQEYDWTGLTLVGYADDVQGDKDLPVLGCVEDAPALIETQDIDDVIIALPRRAYGKINKLIWQLHELPVKTHVVPDYFSLALYGANVEDLGGLPMISLRDPALNDVQRLAKRLFDLLFGMIGILLALPIMGVVAVLVKLDSDGDIFFKQERLGENGKLFPMYKFRTMVMGAEKLQAQVNQKDADGNIIHKRADDPRVTRMGRFLRRTSLDELPQLFNVLRGDMSLVGPRPELPWLWDKYEPWQRKRFSVPQGMTGWWQVNGRAEKLIHLNTEDDLYYVQNYSIWMDFYILLKTPWVVLRGRGAY